VLFMLGVHPDVPSSAVPQPVLEKMMDTARGLLRDNVIEGSSPRIQTYRSLRQLSAATEHAESLWVYGRRDKPCRRCGTPIEMKKMGVDARSTYWCPKCQLLNVGSGPNFQP
jgi:endonuclease-8